MTLTGTSAEDKKALDSTSVVKKGFFSDPERFALIGVWLILIVFFIIKVPSTVEATAIGHGNDSAEIRAMTQAPPISIAGVGRRSTSNPTASPASTSIVTSSPCCRRRRCGHHASIAAGPGIPR